MRNKTAAIPVHNWSSVFSEGVLISKKSFEANVDFDDVGHSHRDDWHLFILQEKGTTVIEIDFQKYKIGPLSVIYIHPNQVHRLLGFDQATIFNWAINNENLKPEYLALLEEISPVKPLQFDRDSFDLIAETATLGVKYAERKQEVLYHPLLKDNCNTLVALVASQYLAKAGSVVKLSRFEAVTKTFKAALEQDYKTTKSPKAYADQLNISTAYLNECVKNTTGQSVSHHIQQRIVLEAERLLYHSGKSVKEIAAGLGYDDYNYFTRLFVKAAGMTPVAFRHKNHE